MNLFNLERAFKQKKERKWNRLYVAIDAHGTLIKPYHDHIEFYPGVREVMLWFNSRHDISTILWTSSHQKDIQNLLIEAEKIGFRFNYVNQNTAEENTDKACFDQKFYFNVLLDDKAGFEPETDWELIKLELIRIGEWNKYGIPA